MNFIQYKEQLDSYKESIANQKFHNQFDIKEQAGRKILSKSNMLLLSGTIIEDKISYDEIRQTGDSILLSDLKCRKYNSITEGGKTFNPYCKKDKIEYLQRTAKELNQNRKNKPQIIPALIVYFLLDSKLKVYDVSNLNSFEEQNVRNTNKQGDSSKKKQMVAKLTDDLVIYEEMINEVPEELTELFFQGEKGEHSLEGRRSRYKARKQAILKKRKTQNNYDYINQFYS